MHNTLVKITIQTTTK